jgi:hypothetical protein
MHLAAGQQEAQRPAERVGEQIDLGRQSGLPPKEWRAFLIGFLRIRGA